MISIAFTAEKEASTEPLSTGHSLGGFTTMDGTNLNYPFGRKTTQIELKQKKTSRKSLKKSKRHFSVERKESSLRSKSNVMSNQRSFEEDLSPKGIKDLEDEYAAVTKAANLWELDVEARYCEDEILSIMGMLSYLENIERGFGHLNDEALFKDERQADSDGKLYEEAVKGFEHFKKCIQLRRLLKEYKRTRVQ